MNTCLTLDSLDESEILRVHSASDHEYARKLFATISLGNSMVKFQLDSGATCNLLPAKYLEDRNQLTPTRKRLKMYNDTMIRPLGTCKMEVRNPENARSYHVECHIFCMAELVNFNARTNTTTIKMAG